MEVLLVQDGELRESFAELAPVRAMIGPGDRAVERFIRRLGWASEGLGSPPSDTPRVERAVRLSVRRLVLHSVARHISEMGPLDLVYLNSLASAPALQLLPRNVPMLTHVHELEYQIRQIGEAAVAGVRARTDRYVAAAECVRDLLISEMGIDAERVDVCHEFIPDMDPHQPAASAAVREELGISDETLVVGSVGAIGWIKAPDVLIHVARRVIDALHPERDVVFLWIGSPALPWTLDELQYDVRSLGLAEHVRFVGPYPDPRPVMSLFDVFALPSRTDPFPLVCLEAASLAIPIVCFDAGGMREFLDPEERLVVPYLDIDAMARRIVELLQSRTERDRLGARLAQRVRERHSVEVAAPRLCELVERMLARPAQTPAS